MFPGIDSAMKKIYYFLLAGKRCPLQSRPALEHVLSIASFQASKSRSRRASISSWRHDRIAMAGINTDQEDEVVRPSSREDLVRMRGLEPPQDCSYSVLSAARLPFRHIRNSPKRAKPVELY